MARLVHLNGAPGVGKSTLARRWAADRPGTLVLDVDVLRTFVSGWTDDYSGAGALVRPVALAAITAYLAQGRDVVLPQLVARPEQLARFAAAADGAGYRHLVLSAPVDVLVARHRTRAESRDDVDPATAAARHIAAHSTDDLIDGYREDLAALVAADPATTVVETVDGDVDATYAALLAALGRG